MRRLSEPTLRETIDQGHEARRAGRLDEALALYHRALELAPQDAEANSLYGLVLLNLGRIAEAEPVLHKAVEMEPQHIGYRINLAEMFERQGKFDEAFAAFRAVTTIAPDFPRAWERLGDLSLQRTMPADAFTYYQRASVLVPSDAPILVKLASAAVTTNRLLEARRILDRALRAAPESPAAFQLYVDLLTGQNDWRTLEQIAAARTRLRPNDAAAWQALTTAFYETGRLREAMELYRKVLEHSVRDAPRLTAYAQYCLNVSEFDEAEEALGEAEALDPDHVEMLSAKALLFTYLGRFDEAEAYCRRCLAQDPAHVPAFRVLNQLKRGRLSEDERAALSRLGRQEGLRISDRISASFSLADCLDAGGQIDEAFAAYEFANNLCLERARRENLDYDRGKRVTWTDTLIASFAAPGLRVEKELGPVPIFIVGMPRSGTTLVESVLAAHSRVFACGERTVMPQVLVDFLLEAKRVGPANISADRWLNWVRAYWYELPGTDGADHITDKNPFNFESVGLITQLFPRAKVVHVRRNPIETGLSIFRNQFPKFVSFTNRLDDIGHYYGQYARLAAHWRRVLGDRFHTVQYEDFVGNFDAAAPALVAACGLDWEEACRDYDKTDRPVATLSAVQVRESVGAGEGRALRYERHVAALAAALNAADVDVVTGALRATK